MSETSDLSQNETYIEITNNGKKIEIIYEIDKNIEVILLSDNNQSVNVPMKILNQIEYFRKIDLKDIDKLPILEMDFDCFQKMIEFASYYYINPMQKIELPVLKNISELVQPFYSNFVYGDNNVPTKDQVRFLHKMVIQTNMWNFEPLRMLLLAKISTLLRFNPQLLRESLIDN